MANSNKSQNDPLDETMMTTDFQTAAKGSKSATDKESLSPTETLMLQLSHNFVHAINTRQFDMALALQDPENSTASSTAAFGVSLTFTAQLVNWPKISSWREYVESFRDEATEWPAYRIDIISSTVSLDNVRDKADVFLLAEETGKPPGVRTVAGSRLEWLKVGSQWMLSKHLMFRGAEMDPMGAE